MLIDAAPGTGARAGNFSNAYALAQDVCVCAGRIAVFVGAERRTGANKARLGRRQHVHARAQAGLYGLVSGLLRARARAPLGGHI